ncbi:TRAP transporter small permease [Xanthomonas campestris pv. campestris]|uniref:TRAP transporter small permease protein n=1 Tax=Xanthomonas campestris pv. campestris (strain B100) TaxID=509169 RepID=B0RLC6_XANCB|nr:TRAP transporter small permease [Xanthomonas campestris]MBF9173706.1 TRAP transporter small permease [Xanthomonas campestris pv. campestris]MCC3256197.1 TRAP transporter small permease [Xanthomonas campestris pv. armoraciae]MCD0251659.1 TRAP transporter small permease [Xanthomonas campestris pv. campestris]MCD0261040.1 TRAP transporter small permease [Xanthomonas campestris pv. campestris]MCD0269306.1 TRAP transporter small permease [Xanthomonas campestris pv. campestris]
MTEPASVNVPVAPLQRALDRVSNVAIGVAAIALLGLVVVQGWQVFTRYVLNDSPSWTEPVTLLLLSTALSLAAAAGVHTNRHFGFYLLGEHMPPLVRRVFDVIRPVMIIAIGAVLAWWSAILLLDGLDIKMAGAQMPQSINYLPLSIGGALMVVFALYKLWRVLRPIHTGGVR